MNKLKPGQYFGSHYQKIHINNFVIFDTNYTHKYVDWHSHKNPYFTFLLKGQVIEENKEKIYTLQHGKLIFHNTLDVHRNIRSDEYTRGLQIEINLTWLIAQFQNLIRLKNNFEISNPYIINNIYKILFLIRYNSQQNLSQLKMIIYGILSHLLKLQFIDDNFIPDWIIKLKNLLGNSQLLDMNLKEIAYMIDIHPVHISRSFRRYFGLSYSQYLTEIKLNKALRLVHTSNYSLTDIAHRCSFYDQSHFISIFVNRFEITPMKYKKTVG